MWRNTLTSVQLWRSSCSQRMTPGKSPNCSPPSFTWAMWNLRVRTDARTVGSILRCVKSLNHLSHWTHYSCIISGTIVNNLEACDIITSDHFNMVSQLLAVGVVFVFATAYKWVEAWGWADCVCPIVSGGSQRAGEVSDSALLHDCQRECDQSSDLWPGCGRQGRLCQSKIAHRDPRQT